MTADLSPERREELAAALACAWCGAAPGKPCREWEIPVERLHEGGLHTPGRLAAADRLAPLIAKWLAEARAEQLTDDDRRDLSAVYGYELGHAEGAAEVRAKVAAVADWCADKEADFHASDGGYAEGARDAYDVAEHRIRAALDTP